MRMIIPGAAIAASVNRAEISTVTRRDSPITRSTACRSPLPQYWADRTEAPLEMPYSSICSTNITCPASEEAASAVWLTKDSMITSAEPTAASIRFCSAIGAVIFTVYL